MIKFKVGDRVRRLPEFRNVGGWDRGDEVMSVDGFGRRGFPQLRGYVVNGAAECAEVAPWRFELVQSSMLARDELYMRLLNDAKVSHEAALEFIAACPSAGAIRQELERCSTTGKAMLRLVVFYCTPRGHRFWFDAALRAGALSNGATV